MLILPQAAPSALMSQMRVQVEAIGDIVRLTIGNAHIDMPYEAGLQISQWLRVRSKEAKRNAGDVSRQWRVVAKLDGVES